MLLGKSSKENQFVSLLGHTEDVCDSAIALFGHPGQLTRLAKAWLRFFKLSEMDGRTFHSNLLASCVFHDWGKANQHMQDLLQGKKVTQLFRHEHLSVLLLGYPGVDSWIKQRADIDWDIVIAAVGSHHLKFSDGDFAISKENETVRAQFAGSEFCSTLVPFAATRLGLNGAPELPVQQFWGFVEEAASFNPTELRNNLRDGRLRRITTFVRQQGSFARMLFAVRAALIAADAVGSGLRRTGQTISDWVEDKFKDNEVCDFNFVVEIIQQRISYLAAQGKWKKSTTWDGDGWNSFQKDCDKLPSRSLLLAPCGAGKTLAAWRWIASQVKTHPVKRVIFLYPTRATATEGFKDYVSWAPEADASLMHGTSEYDLDGMFDQEDPRSGKMFNGIDPRLFALKQWSKKVFSATIDQFLSFMSYGYGPMCLVPLLADSVIVIDEVHSFDNKMFSALLGFLKSFEVPVLCMTATLQAGRKQQLEPLMGKIYEDRPDELAAIANAPRYQVLRKDASEIDGYIRTAVKDGKRVLLVVNQVSRAQARHKSLQDLAVPVICYHSRFKLDHRIERHRETVRAIAAGQPAAVVISTQVCEMSLDIDADVLITEECPISSLIQRMGRCRRGRDELATKGPGTVIVNKPENKEMVYDQEDLFGLQDFLTCLQEMPSVSQNDLEIGMKKYGSTAATAPQLNSFLSSGAYALSGSDSFRDIEAFNDQAVLDAEVNEYLTAPLNEKPGFVLPVPRKLKFETDHRLPPYLRAAPCSHYDPLTGFWDKPL